MMMYRVRHDLEPCVVSHPLTQQFVSFDRAKLYRADDPLVKAFPWAFEPASGPGGPEQATAGPGERRR